MCGFYTISLQEPAFREIRAHSEGICAEAVVPSLSGYFLSCLESLHCFMKYFAPNVPRPLCSAPFAGCPGPSQWLVARHGIKPSPGPQLRPQIRLWRSMSATSSRAAISEPLHTTEPSSVAACKMFHLGFPSVIGHTSGFPSDRCNVQSNICAVARTHM